MLAMSDPQILASILQLGVTMAVAFLTNYVVERYLEIYRRPSHSKAYSVETVIKPPQVAAWIPLVGSSIEMGKDICGFIRKYSDQFETPIFSATIGGKICHFVADPKHVDIGFTPTSKLDHSGLEAQFLVRGTGLDANVIAGVYADTHSMKKANNLLQTNLVKEESMQRNLKASQNVLKEKIIELLPSGDGEWSKVGLYDFCVKVIFAASVGPLLSTAISGDDMAQNFVDWFEGIPSLFANMPSIFLSKSIKAREKMVDGMLDEVALLGEGGSALLKARRKLYKGDLYRRGNLGLVFAAAGNSIPSAFWILASVLSDPEALLALQSEVASFGSASSEKDDNFTFEQLEKCVTMQSMWTETLRLYHAGFTVSDVVKDMVVEMDAHREGGPTTFVLKKGSRLMAFPGIRHTDPDLFDKPDEFVWNRFLPHPTTGKAPVFTTKDGVPLKGDPVIAFGGGAHKWPGRRFIENEVKSLLVYLFTKFELRLAEGESVPGKHLPTQGLGMSFPDREMCIEIRAKTTI